MRRNQLSLIENIFILLGVGNIWHEFSILRELRIAILAEDSGVF